MKGNYSARILEGLAHFFPETRSWVAEDLIGAGPNHDERLCLMIGRFSP
jgi:hypothetical protein